MMMMAEQIRERWKPAANSRLDVALREAAAADIRVAVPRLRVSELLDAKAAALVRLEAVGSDTPTALVATWRSEVAAVDHVLPVAQDELAAAVQARKAAWERVERLVAKLSGPDETLERARLRGERSNRVREMEIVRDKLHRQYLT